MAGTLKDAENYTREKRGNRRSVDLPTPPKRIRPVDIQDYEDDEDDE